MNLLACVLLLQVVVGRTGDQMLTSEAGEVTRWVGGWVGGWV